MIALIAHRSNYRVTSFQMFWRLFYFLGDSGGAIWTAGLHWAAPWQWAATQEDPVPAQPRAAGTAQQPKSGHMTDPPDSSCFRFKPFKIFKFFIISAVKNYSWTRLPHLPLRFFAKSEKVVSVPWRALRVNWALWISHAQLTSVWGTHWFFPYGCGSIQRDLSTCHPSQTFYQPTHCRQDAKKIANLKPHQSQPP